MHKIQYINHRSMLFVAQVLLVKKKYPAIWFACIYMANEMISTLKLYALKKIY